MKDFIQFYSPTKILAGVGVLSHLAYELKLINGEKPMIITDKVVHKIGLLDKVIGVLNANNCEVGYLYDEVPPDSDIKVVNEISRLYKEHQCNGIIAVGGGSVLDTAKGVNITVTENVDNILDLAGANNLTNKQEPLVAIPTTSGTGSEVTLVAVIADKSSNEKLEFISELVVADVALLDPAMTVTLPTSLTIATAFDAMVHAIEAMTCKQTNILSKCYGKEAIRLIKDNLEKAIKHPKNETYRLNLALGSTMAGVAFSNSMVGVVHAIGHALGAVCHIPHGQAMMLLLTTCMDFNASYLPHLYDDLLLSFEDPYVYVKTDEKTSDVIRRIRAYQLKLCKVGKLPMTLKEAGVQKGMLKDIAHNALYDPAILLNPVEVNEEDVLQILEKIYGE